MRAVVEADLIDVCSGLCIEDDFYHAGLVAGGYAPIRLQPQIPSLLLPQL
jgi:hypothetical protein